MRVAIIGVTGLVGQVMLRVLEERDFPVSDLVPVASANSKGNTISFKGKDYEVITAEEALQGVIPNIALFSAGASVSKKWAPAFAEKGCFVIDNSSAWRMDENIPLIVPEVNASILDVDKKIIANPNCSTIQMVVALKPLNDMFNIKRLVIATYQSYTGTGKKAVDQYQSELTGNGDKANMAYPHPIFENCLPHCDVFFDNGYTKEELKLENETRKIMQEPDMKITATAVRVPVHGGHSESVNIEFEKPYDLDAVVGALSNAPGIMVKDDPSNNIYPMPLDAHNKDEVFVGRIRRDYSIDNGLNIWIVSDNLRKGAATNAVQIAEYLIDNVI